MTDIDWYNRVTELADHTEQLYLALAVRPEQSHQAEQARQILAGLIDLKRAYHAQFIV